MSDELDKLCSILDEVGVRVKFGLVAQGHIPTIEKMLQEGTTWHAIGRKIGWDWKTAKDHYLSYRLAFLSSRLEKAEALVAQANKSLVAQAHIIGCEFDNCTCGSVEQFKVERAEFYQLRNAYFVTQRICEDKEA